jgi:hypothetical protein
MAEEEYDPSWRWPTEDDRITVSKRLSALMPEGHRPVFTEKLKGSGVAARVYLDGFWMDFLFSRSRSGYSYDLWSHPTPSLSPLKQTGPSCSSLEEAVDAFAFVWPRFADASSKITFDEDFHLYRCEICDTTVSNSHEDTLVHCLREHPYSETKSALKV